MKPDSLTLAFAGTPAIAAFVLNKLLTDSPHTISRVFTQPDRKAGRGKKMTGSPVKQLALEHNLLVTQPISTSDIDISFIADVDALIVVAYGMLLPAVVLQTPRLGCINLHTSLLPRWRGAAPIQRAIQAGDTETGVSIMQMDTGVDTGPVLATARCSIESNETAGSLHDKLALLGADCLLETLAKLVKQPLSGTVQNDKHACYASKISKSEALLDWRLPAAQLERTIRAFNPSPIAHTELNGQPLRVWSAEVIDLPSEGPPGTLLIANNRAINVNTGRGILRLLTVQPPGKRVVSAEAFLNGRPGFLQGSSAPAT